MTNATANFLKLVGVVLMFLIIEQLGVPGFLIDLLVLGVYYESTRDAEHLAEGTSSDEHDLKKRIEALEKKLGSRAE